MQEGLHLVARTLEPYAVILAGLHVLLDGQGRRTLRIEVDLQGIEQQQHIAGTNQHPFADAGRHAAHADDELIKERGAPPIRQQPGHRRKQLAAGGILGHALAVAAGVNHQQPLAPEGARMLMHIADDAEGGAAAAHAQAVPVGDDGIMGLLRQMTTLQAVVDLLAISLRLILV